MYNEQLKADQAEQIRDNQNIKIVNYAMHNKFDALLILFMNHN